ncbi:MAG: class I SAM-dependent methyltransferase, partial [Anaerolineaceae bacterium]
MHNSKKLSIIELLSCDAIRDNGNILADIVLLQKGLFKEIGWHYYVDLIWIVNRLRENEIYPGSTILDAGAGNGLLQYLLSLYGYNVISIDFSPRKISLLAKLV